MAQNKKETSQPTENSNFSEEERILLQLKEQAERTYSSRLRAMLTLRNATEIDLSSTCDVVPSTATWWTADISYAESAPSFQNLAKMAMYLETSLGYLLGLTDEIVPNDSSELSMVRLPALRRAKNISRNALASTLGGLHPNTIYAWELGKTVCRINVAMFLANLFNVSIDYLLGLSQFRTTEEALCGIPAFDCYPLDLSDDRIFSLAGSFPVWFEPRHSAHSGSVAKFGLFFPTKRIVSFGDGTFVDNVSKTSPFILCRYAPPIPYPLSGFAPLVPDQIKSLESVYVDVVGSYLERADTVGMYTYGKDLTSGTEYVESLMSGKKLDFKMYGIAWVAYASPAPAAYPFDKDEKES